MVRFESSGLLPFQRNSIAVKRMAAAQKMEKLGRRNNSAGEKLTDFVGI